MNDTNAPEIIDMEIIEALMELGGEDDPELVAELIDLYLLDAPDRIREIQNALEGGDLDLLERASHTLKSASANIGASRLSVLCSELEGMARTNHIGDPAVHIKASQQVFADVQAALTEIRG